MEFPIRITRTSHSRVSDVNFSQLEFGKIISDHMLLSWYGQGQWRTPVIQPYGELALSPAILALHYGQAVFEGMKAYRMEDGNISIFRIEKHAERLNRSLHRMAMPRLDTTFFIRCLHTLIEIDQAWVPSQAGSALYIRPVVFATEARLGVKIADEYLFAIITGPVGPYFTQPLRVKVEEQFVRAAEGGTGYAKCAGNYGGAFYPTRLAREAGYDQVLWTDAREHRFIDESGAMNVMFVIDGTLVTPALTSSILDGITRESILTLAREEGIPVEERRVSVDELIAALEAGRLTEAFGTGTAAVVAPIATIGIYGRDYHLPPLPEDSLQMRMKDKLHRLRHGLDDDRYGWNYVIPVKM